LPAGFADWEWRERLLLDVVLKALERTIKGFQRDAESLARGGSWR
jgi:hypothetical protein